MSLCGLPGCSNAAYLDGPTCRFHIGMERFIAPPNLCRPAEPIVKLVPVENERGAGLKFDSGKPRWSLMMQGCALALLGVARVLTFGAKKYAAHSWRSVENGEERYRDALYRHLHEIERGEAIDPESGESHWSHVITNAMFLEELRLTRSSK